MRHAPHRISVIAGAMVLPLLFNGAAATTCAEAVVGTKDLTPVMLVCNADGCRHRFKSYRARPEWNSYWSRGHSAEKEADPVAETSVTTAQPDRLRAGIGHWH